MHALINPFGHLVVAFPERADAQFVRKALLNGCYEDIDRRYFGDRQVAEGTQRGMDSAGALAMIGASLKMVRLQQRLAQKGCHFPLIFARTELDIARAMKVVHRKPYKLAQAYHRFTIETLE